MATLTGRDVPTSGAGTHGRPRSRAYNDALTTYKALSDAELAGELNLLRHELADCGDLHPDSRAVCEALVGDRLAAAEAVDRRRAVRFSAGAGPDPRDEFSTAWHELTERVRETVDLLDLFTLHGYDLIRRGREWSGPCFACGGTDRLVVFPQPDGRHPFPRAWCRRCGGFWDAIAVLRNLRGGHFGFYDAVSELAVACGFPVPATAKRSSMRSGAKGHRPAVEFVGGKVVRR